MSTLKAVLAFVAALLVAWDAGAAPDKRTVCTITVNSPDEQAAMRRHLPERDYKFVNLVEHGRADWLATAWAVWKGGIKDGGGTISTESGVLKEAPYGFKARFETGPGTNPEELIGAAHAGCFSMALSLMLGEAGLTAEKIETHAKTRSDVRRTVELA